MNAEQASALAREFAARMVKLIPDANEDTETFLHAAFMQGWSMEHKELEDKAHRLALMRQAVEQFVAERVS